MNDLHSAQEQDSTIHPYTLSLGLLSVACGGAMLFAPRALGALFTLPPSRTLIRLLGARDVLIGGALLVPASRRLGLVLRSLADTGDGVLIGTEVARGRRDAARGSFSMAVAGLSALTAMRLALR
jgi:hypothetical protein